WDAIEKSPRLETKSVGRPAMWTSHGHRPCAPKASFSTRTRHFSGCARTGRRPLFYAAFVRGCDPFRAEVAVRQADLRAPWGDLNAIGHHTGSTEEISVQRTLFQRIVPWALAAVCLSTMPDTAVAGSERLGDAMLTMVGSRSTSDQKLDALAAAMRAVTGQGLFAEEYDAILEAAQDDRELRQKLIEHMMAPPK